MNNIAATFKENSLLFALALIFFIGLIYGLRAFIGYQQIQVDAQDDYKYKHEEGMIDERLSEAGYIRAYRRFHAPRALSHIAIVLVAIALLTLPMLGLLNYLYALLWQWGGAEKAFTPGFLVHGLSLFFLIIFFWAALAYAAARRYHDNAPISFRDEQLREID